MMTCINYSFQPILIHLQFSFSLVRSMETGILKRVMSRIYTTKPVCVDRQNFQRISIDESLPALLIVPIGVAASFAMLSFELLFKRLKWKLMCK